MEVGAAAAPGAPVSPAGDSALSAQRRAGSIPEWAWIGLLATMILTVWWRGHTFGPTVRDQTRGGVFWPVVRGDTEPLDCDEAAYAYMGRRMNSGAVLYRDLAENKPPGGYWLYALATSLGGANEWTVRVMPIPIVLATLGFIWLLGIEAGGPFAGCLAALLYALLSTDPYIYGNGAQLELPINLASVASLWALARFSKTKAGFWPALAGALLGLACLVRQTALVLLPLYGVWLIARGRGKGAARSIAALAAGFATVVALAGMVLFAQGAWPAFWECVIEGGWALANDTPAPPNAPPLWMRWLTGNADPRGVLPRPFGQTDYLVWWGQGAWPLWLAGAAATIWALAANRGVTRLIGACCIFAWIQVLAPKQFWAHYYLLPVPGIALLVALWFTQQAHALVAAANARRWTSATAHAAIVGTLAAAIAGTAWIQINDYLFVRADQLTVRYKGGAQWVRLRAIGREMQRRGASLENPTLLVWGWQSPLYLYSGMDCPTRHFFVNDLVRSQADRNHPLVGRWTRELMDDLAARPPDLIFTGYPPFSRLSELIGRDYTRSDLVPEVPAMWVRADRRGALGSARSDSGESVERAGRMGLWEWLNVPRIMPARPSAGAGGQGARLPAVGDPR